MSVTKELADEYFAPTNHTYGHAWYGFDDDKRSAAVAHAIRDFERMFQSGYDDDTTTRDDFPRMDLAVYEHALDLLMSAGIANGEYTGPRYTGEDPNMNRENPLCVAARRWLYMAGGRQIEIVRG